MKILAAFDLETTGLVPAVHDIIEIAIVPLNPDFKRSELPEFTARIKAVHPENADPESLKISGLNPLEGEDIQKVATDIIMWMADNHIERIEAVGHNLRFDLDFFQIKFPSLSRIFSRYCHDSMQLAIVINDISLLQTGKKLFPSVSLRNLKLQLGLEEPVQHRAMDDALDAAELYRRLQTKLIIKNPPFGSQRNQERACKSEGAACVDAKNHYGTKPHDSEICQERNLRFFKSWSKDNVSDRHNTIIQWILTRWKPQISEQAVVVEIDEGQDEDSVPHQNIVGDVTGDDE